jgi:hypothetical protein
MEVTVQVAGYPDSDVEERAALTEGLREHLLTTDVEDVRRPASENAEPGAKGEVVELAQLAVALAAPSGLTPLVTALRAWLSRHPSASVSLDVDGDRVELGGSSTHSESVLVEGWARRHGGT